MILEIYTDGACSGNPGPAGVGVVIKNQGQTLKEVSCYIGQGTNNIAEYTALIYGLQEALILRADRVSVFTDSELMFKQLNGEYRVKNEHIKPLFDQVQNLRRGIRDFNISHIPREANTEADRLARNAIKLEQAKVVASEFSSGEKSPGS